MDAQSGLRRRYSLLALLTLVVACPYLLAQEELKPTDNLVLRGIPKIPSELTERVRAYTEARGATFLSWHPEQLQMLISTRFGNSNQVHLVEHPGGARQQLTFFQEPVGSATWEPQSGRYFLFSRDAGGNEFAQLYRFDMATGTIALLTDGKRSQNGGIVWNQAKTQMAYASTQRNGADRDVWIMNPDDSTSNQLLFELPGGGWGVSDWSPDDSQLLLIERLSVNRSNLYLADVKNRTKKLITETKENDIAHSAARFAPNGKGIYFTSDAEGEFQQLHYRDLATQQMENLSREIPWDIESFDISPNGQWIALIANEAGLSRLYLYHTREKKLEALQASNAHWKEVISDLPQGVIGLGEWHPKLPAFAITVSSATSTADVYSINVEKPKLDRWTKSELGGLVANRLAEPKLVSWKSFDDKTISGFLYRPPAAFTGKRPVIINIHGGPEGQSRPSFLGRNNYFISEMGVAILFPNVRGSTGFGKSFVKLDNGMKRLDSVRDIEALLDWIATQPELDASRVMVTGGSYGGYMTLAVATGYNDRIRCALDVVGISHFGTFLKNTESYRRDLRRVEYGDERQPEMAQFFETIAPLNNAGKITKPLFIVQGGNDPRVPLSEAEQMADKVQANGSPLWYLMAKDEGHGFRKKTNADFQFYATIRFVEEYLLGP